MNENQNTEALNKARILSEALPYMRRYAGKTIVVKYGGHVLKQVGVNPIVVHGGGPQINQTLDRLNIKSNFIDGLRVTDEKTVEVVEMVLAGSINKAIVGAINKVGGCAIGLSGKDGGLITARKLTRTKRDPDSNIEKVLDLGFVGEPEHVAPKILETFAKSDIIPVIAPVGVGRDGATYNINADTVAGAVAGAVRAMRLLMMTDVVGVLDKNKKLLSRLTVAQARALIEDGTIHGGMIPKVETCLQSVAWGVEAAVILDGRVPHAILLEMFTESGVGTMIGGAS
jgi:acetylglutamate kinase